MDKETITKKTLASLIEITNAVNTEEMSIL